VGWPVRESTATEHRGGGDDDGAARRLPSQEPGARLWARTGTKGFSVLFFCFSISVSVFYFCFSISIFLFLFLFSISNFLFLFLS
jgi:hypothetical protein